MMSADTVSSLYPHRPIRPLPKRKLRERLAPGIAESIQYPPTPQNITPLFQYPYPLRDDDADPASFPQDRTSQAEPRSSRRNGVGADSDEDDAAHRQASSSRATAGASGRLARAPPNPEDGKYPSSQHLPSAASSVDGYDLLENTNNKKKRKIPAAAEAALSAVHALNDTAAGSGSVSVGQSGEAQSDVSAATSSPYYGSGNFASGGQNIPGPGRGRYGRPRSGRSPLRPLSESTNNYAGRTGKVRPAQWLPSTSENTGIISSAIANAEKLVPQQGQENMSLLQQSAGKRSPATTQFTFTCDSQVPGTLAWPGSGRGGGLQANQTPVRSANESWSRAHQVGQGGHPSPAVSHTADTSAKNTPPRNGVSMQNQQAADDKNSRRNVAREYLAAAKARRREQQLENRHNPPKPEDIWICHFCEYESIFGHPPHALVRQYEIKDRRQRQLQQQRQAQWDRMKKGKHKSKKSSKLAAKTANPAHDAHQPADAHDAPLDGNYSQGTHSEESYGEEDYDGEGGQPSGDPHAEGNPEPPDLHPASSGGRSRPHGQGRT